MGSGARASDPVGSAASGAASAAFKFEHILHAGVAPSGGSCPAPDHYLTPAAALQAMRACVSSRPVDAKG